MLSFKFQKAKAKPHARGAKSQNGLSGCKLVPNKNSLLNQMGPKSLDTQTSGLKRKNHRKSSGVSVGSLIGAVSFGP